MGPRLSKKLENFLEFDIKWLKIHRKLDALNIIDLKMSCDICLKKEYPEKYLLVTELEHNMKYIKNCIDKYDLAVWYKKPYPCIFTYANIYLYIYLYKIVQHLSIITILHSEKNFTTFQGKFLNLNFESQYRLRFLDKLKNLMNKKFKLLMQPNLSHSYISYFTHDYHNNWRTNCDDNDMLEDKLRKFIKVISLIPPVFEILLNDEERWNQFNFLVKLLNLCCIKNIRDSKIIVDILSIVIKIKIPRNENIYIDPLPELFRYILQHTQKMEKQDILFQQEDSENAWDYLNDFSIADAVIWCDRQRIRDLICHGFKVLPKDEQLNTEGEFHDLSLVIPLEHRIILYLMKSIQLHHMWTSLDFGITLTETQKKCFLIVLQHYADFFVTRPDLYESLRIEYEFKLSCNVPIDKCEKEYRQRRRLVEMYATNFYEIAVAPKPKNIFKRFINSPYSEKDMFKNQSSAICVLL